MLSIKQADELLKLTRTKNTDLVDEVLKGVREHVAERCVMEANKGRCNYSIFLKKTYSYAEELLFEKCLKLVKEFEQHGYKVSIDGENYGDTVEYILTFSWNGEVKKYINKSPFNKEKHLYDTDNEIVSKENENVKNENTFL